MSALCVHNFINGEFSPASGGETLQDFGPATGSHIADIPDSSSADVERAVEAAKRAFPSWAALTNLQRAAWLTKIADALEARKETVAAMESQDTGKPITLAKNVDATRSVLNFRFFADLVAQGRHEEYEMADAHNYVHWKPIGVCALITPWNLPLYLLSWKIAPAIAVGNTVVCKPSELTPLTANLLAEVIKEVGLPPGVVNIVHGLGASAGGPLVAHPAVRLVSFTGGTATGSVVAATAAPSFKKLSLELGGKNATIVFADCDLEATVAGAVRAGFTNQGQVCLCGSRLLVERSIYDEFKSKFVAAVKKLSIGDPSDPKTSFGALISPGHREKVLSYIRLAQQEGGTILTGGENLPDLPEQFQNGNWVQPTVIELSHTSRTATEEIFGPVVTMHPFDSEEEAAAIANCVRYGLAGSVWTKDLVKGRRVAESIETGMIWINCWLHRDLRVPFGGVKDSGVGREGGMRSLDFFSECMNICVKETA